MRPIKAGNGSTVGFVSDCRDQSDNRLDQMDPCSPEGFHPEQGPAGGPVCVLASV